MTEKRFKLINGVKKGTHSGIWDNQKQHNIRIGDELWIGEVVAMLNEGVALAEENNELKKENDNLRELIKENVFGMYEEGSLVDLEFKAIAYDDIVDLEIFYEPEPKVIVICKQGKKENVKIFCQMFIPLGIDYEIKEVS